MGLLWLIWGVLQEFPYFPYFRRLGNLWIFWGFPRIWSPRSSQLTEGHMCYVDFFISSWPGTSLRALSRYSFSVIAPPSSSCKVRWKSRSTHRKMGKYCERSARFSSSQLRMTNGPRFEHLSYFNCSKNVLLITSFAVYVRVCLQYIYII